MIKYVITSFIKTGKKNGQKREKREKSVFTNKINRVKLYSKNGIGIAIAI